MEAGLCVLAVYLALFVASLTAAPVKAPDFSQCRNITLKLSKENYRCCPPVPVSVKDYDLSAIAKLPMRVRRPIHTLVNDTEYWEKYNRAYALLRALPQDDPRSHNVQAWMHCSYCNNALVQRDVSPDTVLLIHKSWLFLPWHRWYVFFHERILAELIGDDTFSLPFWNFDNQTAAAVHSPANRMPVQYTKQRWSALQDPLRSKYHQPPQTVDIPFDLIVDTAESPFSDKDLVERNLMTMYRQIYGATVPQVFFGHKYVHGTPDFPGGGTIEYIPHNSIHDWVGDLTSANHENMGNFYSAARDPLFYGLHGNLDRLWTVWKTFDGGRPDPDERDWLDGEFIFFDEHGEAVKVRIEDCLDISKMRYKYEEVENAWKDYKPRAWGSGILKSAGLLQQESGWKQGARKLASWAGQAFSISDEGVKPGAMDAKAAAEIVAKIPLLGPSSSPGQEKAAIVGAPFHFKVARPLKSGVRKVAEFLRVWRKAEEVLEIQGLSTAMMTTNIIDVFINLPEADAQTPITIAEYAGTFYELPHTTAPILPNGEVENQERRVSNFRLGISHVLRDLTVPQQSTAPLIVSLVPRGADRMEPTFFNGVVVHHF